MRTPAPASHIDSPLIAAHGLSVRFGGRTVLSGIDLSVRPGEIVTLIGPNGAGKSTLVRAMLGLVKPFAGRVERQQGLTIGYLPQKLPIDPTLPMTVRRFLRLWGRATNARLAALLDEVGVPEVIDRPVHGLSGGETQRVLIARALMREPDLLVLDEPNQGVDVGGQAAMFRLIDGLRRRHGCGVVLISHDLHLVMAGTDRVVCLNGHVCCEGHPEAVSRHPEYLALFGPTAEGALAVYQHQHDHSHDLHGEVIDPPHSHGGE
jgi:zinc transport system ATP-binding protein